MEWARVYIYINYKDHFSAVAACCSLLSQATVLSLYKQQLLLQKSAAEHSEGVFLTEAVFSRRNLEFGATVARSFLFGK